MGPKNGAVSREHFPDATIAAALAFAVGCALWMFRQSDYWGDGRFLIELVEVGAWRYHNLLYLPAALGVAQVGAWFGADTQSSLLALSVVTTALASAVTFLAARELRCTRGAALTVSALLATAPSAWFLGTCIEVHSMQLCAASVAVHWAVRAMRAWEQGRPWSVFSGALAWALVAGTHLTGVLWLAPLGLFWLRCRAQAMSRSSDRPRHVLPAVAVGVGLVALWLWVVPSRGAGVEQVSLGLTRLLSNWSLETLWSEVLRGGGALHVLAAIACAAAFLRHRSSLAEPLPLAALGLYGAFLPFVLTLNIFEWGGYYVSLLPVAALASAVWLTSRPGIVTGLALATCGLHVYVGTSDVRWWQDEYPGVEWAGPLIESTGGQGVVFCVDDDDGSAAFRHSRFYSIAVVAPRLPLDIRIDAVRAAVLGRVALARSQGGRVALTPALHEHPAEHVAFLRSLLSQELGSPTAVEGGAWIFPKDGSMTARSASTAAPASHKSAALPATAKPERPLERPPGQSSGQPSGRPPNVVLIVADDQGYGDFGFQGHPSVVTKHLDRLASQGLVYTRGYVTSPLCRPSLGSLATGLHPHTTGITSTSAPWPKTVDAAPEEVRVAEQIAARMTARIDGVETIAARLADHGYASFQAGKWWEGDYERGGFTAGMTTGDTESRHEYGDAGVDIGRKTMEPVFDFLDEVGEQPFFLWFTPMMPHLPHDPPAKLLDKYLDKTESIHVARYWAMCEWFDRVCGRLLGALHKRDLAQDTLVIFLVDNGWVQRPDSALSAPEGKASPMETGVRTPIVLRWPGRIEPDRDDTTPVSAIDVPATILAACGLSEELPGVGLLDRAAVAQRGAVFGASYRYRCQDVERPVANVEWIYVVDGRWKLLLPSAQNTTWPGPVLFDVVADPHGLTDLAAEQVSVVQRMRGSALAWWPEGVAACR